MSDDPLIIPNSTRLDVVIGGKRFDEWREGRLAQLARLNGSVAINGPLPEPESPEPELLVFPVVAWLLRPHTFTLEPMVVTPDNRVAIPFSDYLALHPSIDQTDIQIEPPSGS